MENETCDLTELLLDQKPPTRRWVFKIQYGSNSEIQKYKARWVSNRHQRKYGSDYNKTWTGVVKPASFRFLFLIKQSQNLNIKQIDVIAPFLYNLIDKIVYS